MKKKIIRLIAFEVRPRRIAYAVFETPTRLLDWGVRKASPSPIMSGGFTIILETFHPSVFVLRRVEPGSRRDNPRTKEHFRAIESEAKDLGVPVAFLTNREIGEFFRRHERGTKHQIAEAIGEWFPELATQVPPPRKPWQPEHWRMVIFDAMATAMAYLAVESADPDSD